MRNVAIPHRGLEVLNVGRIAEEDRRSIEYGFKYGNVLLTKDFRSAGFDRGLRT